MQTINFNNRKLTPGKIVCVGLNYAKHISELNSRDPEQMVLFIKPNSSISSKVNLAGKRDCHYEGEISFLIKNKKIIAVAFGLDLTLRKVQANLKKRGLPWEKAKVFPGSAVFSNFTPIKPDQIENLSLKLFIDNKLVQQGGFKEMIYKPNEILQEADQCFGLNDYDILMTGTPQGVGNLKTGQKLKGLILNNNQISNIFKTIILSKE
jgi:2-keto-4-pentenoate hydratase/2-oxohepta-3-ene-1,7-dioic acid hydratase in catechol pathway